MTIGSDRRTFAAIEFRDGTRLAEVELAGVPRFDDRPTCDRGGVLRRYRVVDITYGVRGPRRSYEYLITVEEDYRRP